jgi:hypothetical protein
MPLGLLTLTATKVSFGAAIGSGTNDGNGDSWRADSPLLTGAEGGPAAGSTDLYAPLRAIEAQRVA